MPIYAAFLSLVFFTTFTAFAIVGGQITSNSKIWKLSQCEPIVSHIQGTYHGCQDLFLATGSAISFKEILTAGHFADHFLQNKQNLLKAKSGKREFLLYYLRDFVIHMPKQDRAKSKSSTETCEQDFAIIKLTANGLKRLQFENFYDISSEKSLGINERVQIYGHGAHEFEVYSEKKRTLRSSLGWLLSFGETSSKTWIKNIKSDGRLREGSNVMLKASDAWSKLEDQKYMGDKDLYAITAKMGKAHYYSSYTADGDSGGPIVFDNKIVGISCSINSFHDSKEITFVNLITPINVDKLRVFRGSQSLDR